MFIYSFIIVLLCILYSFISNTTPDTSHSLKDIDIVYTWVNGSYPGYREQYLKYSKKFNYGGTVPSIPTLKYSIRSVLKHFESYRNIYIITMRPQKPYWLVENERCKIIYHDEIIEEKYLPTFNSHTIQARMHRIPGLSDNFIYLNDDFIIGKRTLWQHFSKNNKSVFFENIHYESSIPMIKWFDFNNQVPTFLYTKSWHVKQHVPMLINKYEWEWMQILNNQKFDRIMKLKTKRIGDYPVIYYFKHMRKINSSYVVSTYDYIMNHLQFDAAEHWLTFLLLNLIKIYRPRFITINDPYTIKRHNISMTKSHIKYITDWLENQYPTKSPYEKE